MRITVRDPENEYALEDVSAATVITVVLLDEEKPDLRFERLGSDATLLTITSDMACACPMKERR